MEQPLVSVIIPTYNRAHFIGQTLDSVLAQTYENWECIVVNDGSTDYTDELLEFYTEKDARIQYYNRPLDRPKGANASRNYGFELSKGEYINWFDSDDLMDNVKLSKQVGILEKNRSLKFCTCEYGLYNDKLELIAHRSFKSSNLLEDYILGKAFFNFQTSIFRKNSLFEKPLDESLYKAQEMEFFFRFLERESINYRILNKEFVKVRLHDQNITHSFTLGDKKAISSEMKVRLAGLTILKNNNSSVTNLNLALNNYMKFLKAILIQEKMGLYYRFLYALVEVLPLSKFVKVLKLMSIGMLFNFTGKGLYYYRKEFNFK